MDGPCFGLWSTDEHKKWQVFSYVFNLDMEMGTVWAALLELDGSSAMKPTVLTRCVQGGWSIGRGSTSVVSECSIQAGTNATNLARVPSRLCSPTPAQLSCSSCPGHRTLWTHHRCAMPLLIARCCRCDLNFIFPKEPEKQKTTNWTKNQELGFSYLFMVSSWLGLPRWTSVIQITHQ